MTHLYTEAKMQIRDCVATRVAATAICVLGAAALILSVYSADLENDSSPAIDHVLLSDAAKQRLDEAVSKAGKGPSPAERAKLSHLLMPIANHLATRFLYTEVAERARANPTKPGHQAMEAVLASKQEENKIEGMVKNKLANIHSGEWAEEVYTKTPAKYHKLIPALATQAAHSSTVYAFKHLKEQMLAAEKNPTFLKRLSPTDPNS